MRWAEISTALPLWQVERAAAVLLRECPAGFSDTAAGRGRRVLRAYLPADPVGRATLARLRRGLAHGVPGAAVTVRVIDDAVWHEAWKAHARPVRIGRLLILPTWWPDAGRRGDAVVRLDPGMAFGSGEHATTQLCLRAVERYVRPGGTVVDVGTGSGILAMAAARIGARRVVAVDSDPVAVNVARVNVRANGLTRRVAVRLAGGLRDVRVRADFIVANLTAQTLTGVLRDVHRRLAPGGRFVGSGFGPSRTREITRGVTGSGLRVVGVTALRGWRAIHAVRPP